MDILSASPRGRETESMPYTINATGTTYYGRALKAADGSYVVTEWIVLLGLPVLPLGSKRVLYQSYESRWRGGVTRYKVIPVPIYWPQIAWGYAITAGVLSGLWLMGSYRADWVSDNIGWLLPIGLLVLIIGGMVALLVKRRRRSTESANSNILGWAIEHANALWLGAAVGLVVGVALAFVLTADGMGFVDWLLDQEYFHWSAVGWGVLGIALGPALVLLSKLVKG